MQPARFGAKLSSSKSQLGKLIDVQAADKLSEPDDTGLNLGSPRGKGCNNLPPKTGPVCHNNSKTSPGVKLDRVHVEEACGTSLQSKKLCITVQTARIGATLGTSK